MTVAELIEELKKLPPALEVFTDDYAGGEYDLHEPQVQIKDFSDPRWPRKYVSLNG